MNLHKRHEKLINIAMERGWLYNFSKSAWCKDDKQLKTLSEVLDFEGIK